MKQENQKNYVNALYLQSGGPTSVINASMKGVIDGFKDNSSGNLYFSLYGVEGLINDNIISLDSLDKPKIRKLEKTPGTFLGSARHRLKPFLEDDHEYLKILEIVKKYDIHLLILNGGNDSMDTGYKLNEYFKYINYPINVVGVPKTIDNDLMVTDHTPGYGSASRFIVSALASIYLDNLAYRNGKINIVEIMGRDTGWLTASCVMLQTLGMEVDLVYIPESSFDENDFLVRVNDIYARKRRGMIVVSEGIKNSDGDFVLNNKATDSFNHVQLGGVGSYLANLIASKLNIKTRAVELSILQRSYALQASNVDIEEAYTAGYIATLGKEFNVDGMVIFTREKNYSLNYSFIPFAEVANKIKYLPLKYYDEETKQIKKSFIRYIKPLLGSLKDFKYPIL